MKRRRHHNPIPLRQPGERPIEALTRTIAIGCACSGNGKPGPTAPGISFGRARSNPCQKRLGKIAPGSTITIAAWANRPLVTIHCQDCAEKYGLLPASNEADTTKNAETRASSGVPYMSAKIKDVTETPENARHELPQEAPTANQLFSERPQSSNQRQKKHTMDTTPGEGITK